MWARTTLRHTLRASTTLAGGGKLAVSSGIALSVVLPLSTRLMSSSAPAASPHAKCTRWLVHDASSMAPRECPTPLVLLRTPRLTYSSAAPPAEEESFRAWADTFASRGYTAVEVDVTVNLDTAAAAESSDGAASNGSADAAADAGPHGPSFPEPIASAKSALNTQLRLLNIPFAPVLIASGPAGLVAQAYVSDHAASGLVLVDPPADEDPRGTAVGTKAWAWPSFNYEPRFPILLMPTVEGASEAAVAESRVGRAAEDGVGRGGQGVSIVPAAGGMRGEPTRMEIERWMDRCGF